MSKLDFKGYKKWQRENCGSHLVPSDKEMKRKHFRCVRRIIKQKLKSGEWSTNDPKNRGGFPFTVSAEGERKEREERKRKKQTYHECGNRRLCELKCTNSHTIACNVRCGDMMLTDGGWQYIQSK